ncbi:MAG TPA: hypothetical protein VKM93_17140 [Terriglobia bacterium]|nr:hypothetical protein [Terriglobia bacterium]
MRIVELLLSYGPHKMRVSEYMTKLPSKKLLEDRLRIYSRLLQHDEERQGKRETAPPEK